MQMLAKPSLNLIQRTGGDHRMDLGIYEARDLAQNQPLWRLMSLQCYALVVVHATVRLDSPGAGRCPEIIVPVTHKN